MKLPFELVQPLVFFDLETTGLDVKNDRIVELALIKVTPQGDVLERVRRYNPGLPIPPEATAVHGITDADVAEEHPFCRTARSRPRLPRGGIPGRCGRLLGFFSRQKKVNDVGSLCGRDPAQPASIGR